MNGKGKILCESRLNPRSCVPNSLDVSYEVAELVSQRLSAFLHHSRNVLQMLRSEVGRERGKCGQGGRYKPEATGFEPHCDVLNNGRDHVTELAAGEDKDLAGEMPSSKFRRANRCE